jgi:chromate transporter
MATEPQQSNSSKFKEVALLFLRLGATAWGGPAVSVAMMHDEVVHRRKWIDDQRFLDIFGATNLIPGPNATEIATHLGLIRAGWKGFFSAGILFLIPGSIMALILAWIYVNYGGLPQVSALLYGIKPVVIAIIIQALITLGKRACSNWLLLAVGVATLALYFLGVNEMILLFAGAAIVLLTRGGRKLISKGAASLLCVPSLINLSLLRLNPFLSTIASFSNTTLFLSSLKIGSLMFGSGYVLIAFAKSEFVTNLGWISNAQLIDAIAIGQALPGPLSKSITFIGYLLGGVPSALIATIGFFLPSFILVALLSKIVVLIRKNWWAAAFIDGVNVTALGLMAGATISIARTAVVDIFSIFLTLASFLLIFKYKVSSHWIILGGGVLGIAYKFIIG